MITTADILSIKKEDLCDTSKLLSKDDLSQLIDWLNEKNNEIRYQSLLLLQYRSQITNDVYQYWNVFCNKLHSDNSYHRSIGVILLSENVRWDGDNKIDNVIDEYLSILSDEKPITVRQCIQSLSHIINSKPHLIEKISYKLMSIDLLLIKESMRKLILTDILNVFIDIRNQNKITELDSYIANALTGEILDRKSKKMIEAKF